MNLTYVEGDNIDHLATEVMAQTLYTLKSEGIISNDVVEEWVATRICLRVDTRPIWSRICKKLGIKVDKETLQVRIFKVSK